MKDILDYKGFQNINSPRSSIKMAFKSGIIDDGEIWLSCLESRNLTTHTYNETLALEIEKLIREKYFFMI